MVGGCSRSIRLIWRIDIRANGLLEDIKSIELIYRSPNLAECFAESVGAGLWAVAGEDGVEDAFEEGMAGVCRADQADGGDGHGFGGVEADEICLSLLCLPGLCLYSLTDLSLSLFEDCGIYGLAKLREDLTPLAIGSCSIAGTASLHRCSMATMTTPLALTSTSATHSVSLEKSSSHKRSLRVACG